MNSSPNSPLSCSRIRFTAIIVAAVLSVLCDQFSKYYLLFDVGLIDGPPVTLTSFFNLVMVWNRGVSFGMFSGWDAKWMLAGLSGIICCTLLVWSRTFDRAKLICTGAIIGGAVGNVIDRFVYGAVADFFDVHVAGYHWPAFNVADMCIVCGVLMLLWLEMRGQKSI
ncbi:MAG: signal peptidase II [Alphaproteobacteria bacterium]|nr:MAG: signal peptidase II [Alphaproteobacteria bacterium]